MNLKPKIHSSLEIHSFFHFVFCGKTKVFLPLVTKVFHDLALEEATIQEAKNCFITKKSELGTSMPNNCMIWIATDVFGRFLLEDGNLYVRRVPGKCHARVSPWQSHYEHWDLETNDNNLNVRDIQASDKMIRLPRVRSY